MSRCFCETWDLGRERMNVKDEALKAELGTEDDAQIVVRAAVKENVVSRFRPQPDPVSKHLNTGSWK